MFQKDKSLFLVSSASPFTKNLSVSIKNSEQTRITIAHNSRFNLLTLDNKSNVASDCIEVCTENDKDIFDKDIVIQIHLKFFESLTFTGFTERGTQLNVKWIEFELITLLVVALHKGLKIYNNNGSEVLFTYSFTSTANDFPENTYTSGIASLDSSVVCIGCYSGSILKLLVKGLKNISLCEGSDKPNHNRPICDLVSNNEKQLISCDDSGIISIWEFIPNKLELEKKNHFDGYNGFSCNCLGLYKTYLCAGYGSGHLRVFDITNKTLICEISAHSKWITSVDIALESGLILSTSEDSFVRVWEISEEMGNTRVNHKFSQNIPNTMLFGGVFLNRTGNSFCVVGYDSVELHLFKSN